MFSIDFEEVAKITGTTSKQCEEVYNHMFRSLRDEISSGELNDVRIKELGVFKPAYHKVAYSIKGLINILKTQKESLDSEKEQEIKDKIRKLWIVYKKKQFNKVKKKQYE
jgi:nucleoid DNA-binding protein